MSIFLHSPQADHLSFVAHASDSRVDILPTCLVQDSSGKPTHETCSQFRFLASEAPSEVLAKCSATAWRFSKVDFEQRLHNGMLSSLARPGARTWLRA